LIQDYILWGERELEVCCEEGLLVLVCVQGRRRFCLVLFFPLARQYNQSDTTCFAVTTTKHSKHGPGSTNGRPQTKKRNTQRKKKTKGQVEKMAGSVGETKKRALFPDEL